MRANGILMHITSLPSPYGIGTMGGVAYEFVDFLSAAGQRYWQILPLGHTGYGDSPYQTFSAFAGNPYLIDLDLLKADGLLTGEEISTVDWGSEPVRVDYGRLWESRFSILRLAAERGWERDREAVRAFCERNARWLPDYALFMALKTHFGGGAWTQWPEELRLRSSKAILKEYKDLLEGDIRLFTYAQFLFFRQWEALRRYARSRGVYIIGDVPIYVPMDSADVWACPENFQLDGEGRPECVAGVPPDYFSENGQLWGNPLYDWERMKEGGYAWWMERLASACALYDVIRMDHFRGLDSYWAVPRGETTAVNGQWRKGPGVDFIREVKARFPRIRLIAEDLGILTESVHKLRRQSGFPGMKVLEFAFDAGGGSAYLPHRCTPGSVCYTGTHDNAPLGQFIGEMPEADRTFMVKYLGLNREEGYIRGVLRGGMSSPSGLFIAQMQDWLELGADARMNRPGTVGGNWCWRAPEGAFSPTLAARIREMTELYGRCGKA